MSVHHHSTMKSTTTRNACCYLLIAILLGRTYAQDCVRSPLFSSLSGSVEQVLEDTLIQLTEETSLFTKAKKQYLRFGQYYISTSAIKFEDHIKMCHSMRSAPIVIATANDISFVKSIIQEKIWLYAEPVMRHGGNTPTTEEEELSTTWYNSLTGAMIPVSLLPENGIRKDKCLTLDPLTGVIEGESCEDAPGESNFNKVICIRPLYPAVGPNAIPYKQYEHLIAHAQRTFTHRESIFQNSLEPVPAHYICIINARQLPIHEYVNLFENDPSCHYDTYS